MLANWVKETTTTTGTGTMTLAGAVTGFLAFNDVLADGEQVEYFIESGNNREYGIGTFTASGTTLARTEPLQTLVSGTLDDTAPSAISLSGTSDVYIDASSLRIGNGPVLGQGPSISTWRDCPDNVIKINSAANYWIADVMQVFYGYLAIPRKITTLKWEVTTLDAAAGNFHLGIYKIKRDGDLGDVIYQNASSLHADLATTGEKSHTVSGGPIILPSGMYGFATTCDSTVVRIYGPDHQTDVVGPGLNLNSASERRYGSEKTGVTGSLSDDPTSIASGSSIIPLFWWE